MVMKWVLFLLVVSTLISCSSVNYRSVSPNTQIYVKGSTLYFIGNINSESFPKFSEIVENNKIDKLVISSGGGSIHVGMQIAKWVYDSNIDVEVVGLCASSCANYIFPAAKNKYIVGSSIVAWHGNFHDLLWKYQNRLPKDNTGLENIIEGVRQEIEFYKHIGVDEIFCRIGKLPPTISRNFYTLSESSLTHFGIDNIFYAQKASSALLYPELIKIIDDKVLSIVNIHVDLEDIALAKERFSINKEILATAPRLSEETYNKKN